MRPGTGFDFVPRLAIENRLIPVLRSENKSEIAWSEIRLKGAVRRSRHVGVLSTVPWPADCGGPTQILRIIEIAGRTISWP